MSWDEENKLPFSIYKKPGDLVKYLNMDSHHHRHHKTAVLAGVELHLALPTTMTPANADMSLSDIYPDEHDTLQIAGQVCRRDKMRMLKAILDKD
jgi:hypothetical protein